MDLNEEDMKMSVFYGIKSLAALSAEGKIGKTIPTGCKIINEFLRYFS